jgi:hypothetical protein
MGLRTANSAADAPDAAGRGACQPLRSRRFAAGVPGVRAQRRARPRASTPRSGRSTIRGLGRSCETEEPGDLQWDRNDETVTCASFVLVDRPRSAALANKAEAESSSIGRGFDSHAGSAASRIGGASIRA